MGVDFVNSVDDAAEGVGTTRINMKHNCGLLSRIVGTCSYEYFQLQLLNIIMQAINTMP